MTETIIKPEVMHPAQWAKEVLGVTLWEKQIEVLDLIYNHNRVSVKSGHGVGKTMLAACAALWFLCEYSPCLVITTAPTFRQVVEILWGEINQLWPRTPHAKGKLGICNLSNIHFYSPVDGSPVGRRAIGITARDPQNFQGWHEENIFAIVDESGGVADEMHKALLGLVTSENAKLLLLGNPIVPEGYFYKSHMPGSGFETLTISTLENPNCVSGKNTIPGLSGISWVEEMKREWGEDSPAYRARVIGEFPDSAEDALIPRQLVIDALERGKAELPPIDVESLRMGVDVARYGGDKTVFAIRDRHAFRYIEAYQGKDLMHTVARVQMLAGFPIFDADGNPIIPDPCGWVEFGHKISPNAVALDDTGLGGGATDRLRELNFGLMPIDFGMRAIEYWKYANMRAEMYFTMARSLNSSLEPPGAMAIPPEYEFVCRELLQPHYTFTSSQQIKLEPKKDIKKRLGRSPDHADALALTYAPLAPSMKIERL